MSQWLVWHWSLHLKEPGMIMVSLSVCLTSDCHKVSSSLLCWCGPDVGQANGTEAWTHPFTALQGGKDNSPVPLCCTAPCILGGWQRSSTKYSMLSSTLAKLLCCLCMLQSRSPPEEHLTYEGYVQPADTSRLSVCTQTTSGKLLSANLDPKPVEGSAIASNQVFPPDMWRYSPKTQVFQWEMPFFSWPPLMGLQDELASLSCSIKVFLVQKDVWSFPHLEAVADTTGIKPLQLQRVQLNSDVNNTLSSAWHQFLLININLIIQQSAAIKERRKLIPCFWVNYTL